MTSPERHSLLQFLLAATMLCASIPVVAAGPAGSDLRESVRKAEQAFGAELEIVGSGRSPDLERLQRALKLHFYGFLGRLEELDDQSLAALYRAFSAELFYSHHPAHAEHLLSISLEFARRRAPIDPILPHPRFANHLQATHAALVNARLFDRAAWLSRRFPGEVPGFPPVVAASAGPNRPVAPSLIVLGTDGGKTRLNVVPAPVASGRWLVAVVHPNCGFSKRAMQFVEGSPAVRRMLPDNALWIAGQGDTANLQPILDWNDGVDLTKIAISYLDATWPEGIAFLETPVFYVVDEGKVIHELIGWPGSEGPEKFESMLRDFFPAERK